jgi:hypothetical protein
MGNSFLSRFVSVPTLHKETLQHYIRLQTFLTMRFSNPLISLVAVIVLASGVTASAIPESRDSSPTQSCSTGSLSCCSSVSPFDNLSENQQSSLIPILDLSDIIANIPVGLNCLADGELGWYCTPRIFHSIRWLTRRSNNEAVCCSGIQSQSRCLASLQPLALADELIQMASSTLALTASSCDSLFTQSSCSSCSGCLTRSRRRARRGISCLVLPAVDEILSHRLHVTCYTRRTLFVIRPIQIQYSVLSWL